MHGNDFRDLIEIAARIDCILFSPRVNVKLLDAFAFINAVTVAYNVRITEEYDKNHSFQMSN